MQITEMQPSIIELFIKSQLQQTDLYIENHDPFMSLFDFRVIQAGAIRRSGSTTACARMFDPQKDIYVSYSYAQVCEFNNILYSNNIVTNKKIDFCYTTMANIINTPYISGDTQVSLLKKLCNYTLNEVDYKPFKPFEKILMSMLREYNYVYPNNLRGRRISSGAIVWIDLGNGMSIKYMDKIRELINMMDQCQGDGTQKYVIL